MHHCVSGTLQNTFIAELKHNLKNIFEMVSNSTDRYNTASSGILLYWGRGTDYTKFWTLNCIHCSYMAKLEFEASLYSKDQCLLR